MDPKITKYEKGILEWEVNGNVAAYTVRIDGVIAVRKKGLGCYDTNAHAGAHELTITAEGDGTRIRTVTLALVFDAEHRTLRLAPVRDITVKNGVLRWKHDGGAKGYAVYDLALYATYTERQSYDIEGILGYKNLVYAVLPVSDNPLIRDWDVSASKIDYLRGKGSEEDPYRIYTPFDLRAVDYYEALYAERRSPARRNHYRIENDLDFAAVAAHDDESDIFTLSRPFFGVLDGNGKVFRSVRVYYDGGYWALFDYIADGGEVFGIKFNEPVIDNVCADSVHPVNSTIATVAYVNHGTVRNIAVHAARYTAVGGAVCGIAAHNYGAVHSCRVSGIFRQKDTGLLSQACYEMSGVVLENHEGGKVVGCTVSNLVIEGTYSASAGGRKGEIGARYGNIRTVGGIVAVNRRGGDVVGNMYSHISAEAVNAAFEAGGIVAYNAAGGTVRGNECGVFRIDGAATTQPSGCAENGFRGACTGKNDGQ